MKNPKLISETTYQRSLVILPIICLLLFAGCANLGGTAGHQTVTNHAAAYMEQQQETTANPVDQDPDPTYEWSY
ncbi:MAG TPA: hypothetical protein VK673_06980 [Chthoniobacterales bacterium]|nr:hypothetical protein [Chthoniobacterales bacterium]